MIAYRAMLDVPRELVARVSRLLAAERRRLGTRRNTRALSCWREALLGLVWFRKREDMVVLAAGFGVSRATAYRYRDELVRVLHAQAPDLHEALAQVAEQGWSHVVLDGKVFRSDRCAESIVSAKGVEIDSWYSGKHHTFGGNIQAVMRPDGFPVWVGDAAPGHHHDITSARAGHVLGALYWAASQLGLPTLADSGYEGAGHGVYVPVKQPRGGRRLGVDHQAYNALHRATRVVGERGFALLTGRWRALQRTTISPSRIGMVVSAGLVLTQIEYRLRGRSC